jgi:hypothetical protein
MAPTYLVWLQIKSPLGHNLFYYCGNKINPAFWKEFATREYGTHTRVDEWAGTDSALVLSCSTKLGYASLH